MARATDAAPVLARNADLTERRGRVADESLSATAQLGGFAMATPSGYGGLGSDAVTMALTFVELGRACPSTAWIAGTAATAKTMTGVVIGEAALREVFSEPEALMCGTAQPLGKGMAVPGGFRVSGRWPYVSGCEDASWTLLGVLLDAGDDAPPTYSLAVVPVSELTLDRTWHMAGMCGTGSNSLVADELFVPEHRTSAMSRPSAADALFYAMTTLGPAVGAARGALDVVIAMFASDRKPSMTSYSRMGESPGARHWLAEATLLIDSATRRMLDVCRRIDGVPAGAITPLDHAALKLELTTAADECRRAVDKLLDLHGSSGFTESNPLQRFWRDLAVASRHPHLNPYLGVEDYGRRLTGVESP